jgi:hypothetical protein
VVNDIIIYIYIYMNQDDIYRLYGSPQPPPSFIRRRPNTNNLAIQAPPPSPPPSPPPPSNNWLDYDDDDDDLYPPDSPDSLPPLIYNAIPIQNHVPPPDSPPTPPPPIPAVNNMPFRPPSPPTPPPPIPAVNNMPFRPPSPPPPPPPIPAVNNMPFRPPSPPPPPPPIPAVNNMPFRPPSPPPPPPPPIPAVNNMPFRPPSPPPPTPPPTPPPMPERPRTQATAQPYLRTEQLRERFQNLNQRIQTLQTTIRNMQRELTGVIRTNQTRTVELQNMIREHEQQLQNLRQQLLGIRTECVNMTRELGSTRHMERIETDFLNTELARSRSIPFNNRVMQFIREEHHRINQGQMPRFHAVLPRWVQHRSHAYQLSYYREIIRLMGAMIADNALICPSQCELGGNEVYRICELHRTTQRGAYEFIPEESERCLWFTKEPHSGQAYSKPLLHNFPPTPGSISIKRRLLDIAQYETSTGTILSRSLSMNLNFDSRLPVPFGRHKLLNSRLIYTLINLVVQKIIWNPNYQFDETTGNFLAYNVPALPGQPQSIINLIQLYRAFGADPEQESYNHIGLPERPYRNTNILRDPDNVNAPNLRISSENRGRRMSYFVEDKVLAYNFVEIFDCITDIFHNLLTTSPAGISGVLNISPSLENALDFPRIGFDCRILGYYASAVERPIMQGRITHFHGEQCIDRRYFLSNRDNYYKIFRPMELIHEHLRHNTIIPDRPFSTHRGGGKEDDYVSLIYDIDITGYPINFLMETILLQKESTEMQKLLKKIKNKKQNRKTRSRKTKSRKTKSRKTKSRKTKSRKTTNRKTSSRKTRSRKTSSRKTSSRKTSNRKTTNRKTLIRPLPISQSYIVSNL